MCCGGRQHNDTQPSHTSVPKSVGLCYTAPERLHVYFRLKSTLKIVKRGWRSSNLCTPGQPNHWQPWNHVYKLCLALKHLMAIQFQFLRNKQYLHPAENNFFLLKQNCKRKENRNMVYNLTVIHRYAPGSRTYGLQEKGISDRAIKCDAINMISIQPMDFTLLAFMKLLLCQYSKKWNQIKAE